MSKSDQEEQEILDAFESGKLQKTKNASITQKRHKQYAEAMFKKDGTGQFNRYARHQ
jgi:hypothetical protein